MHCTVFGIRLIHIIYTTHTMSDDNTMTLTENGAYALPTSGNSFVDFFMMFVRGISNETLDKYMSTCWNQDPEKTVGIVFHARDRENGKKEKNISNRAMIWLRKHKYNTYQKNLRKYVSKYGCWKDVSYIALKMAREHSFETSCFAKQLQLDKENLETRNYNDISLCAKWASSEKDKYDVNINLAHDIASELFPDNVKVMHRYRKEVLVPLRKHIDIVETYMSDNKWSEIKYDHVPAVATKRLRNAFIQHDKEGYEAFLAQVRSGEKKIKVTGILPHELVKHYIKNGEYDETIELQWKALVENVKQQGLLNDMLPIVDVSGSMFGFGNMEGCVQPIDVSIALGLLISECSSGTFANKVISFHAFPTICEIKGDSLYERVQCIQNIPAGMNTDFMAVFDLLLNAAKMFNIPKESMPKKLIVLSDMQFDAASRSISVKETTLYDEIIMKYKDTVYIPPKFIYWNLSTEHDEAFPVRALSENVAMISGFSEQLLKVFMNSDDFNAESIIDEILKNYILEVEIDTTDVENAEEKSSKHIECV